MCFHFLYCLILLIIACNVCRGTNAFLKKQLDQSNGQLKVAQDEHSKQLSALQHTLQMQQLYANNSGAPSPVKRKSSARSPSISPVKSRGAKVQHTSSSHSATTTTTTSQANNVNTTDVSNTDGSGGLYPSPHFMQLLQREQERSQQLQEQMFSFAQQQQQSPSPNTNSQGVQKL